LDTEFVFVTEPRSDDSLTDRLRFLMAQCVAALGAAASAIAFRSSLTLWYRTALGAGNVVEAIARLPWWMRLGLPAVGDAVAGLIARLRATPVQGVSNVMGDCTPRVDLLSWADGCSGSASSVIGLFQDGGDSTTRPMANTGDGGICDACVGRLVQQPAPGQTA
jgi:hypothetical protein